jgi:NAD(P)-dependent dehydrogenase (short-subunit alcohol dehydrogenase family)
MSDEDWRLVLDTNLSGSFFVARSFLPTFLAHGRGRFIFISSIAAGGLSGQANYAASKAGLSGLSGALAKEYGRKGITSNVIVPGFFETDMTRETMSAQQKSFWLQFCPLGRMGHLGERGAGGEIAGMVLFLASAEAAFVNGQAISVTGGLDWSA